ncbi:hypothetical protein ACIRU3_19560 [Streptomyces sp. NPDC101151]|uniref:hypothetical protein n=1 Tax=Streptomyces sp. NPDC101151 TaxID=3366115 RepID=UPI003811480C
MDLVPGWVWQGGPVRRALGVGLGVGFFFGAFVVVESGSWVGAAVVVVVLTPLYGVRGARRMSRLWPDGSHLEPADRARVVRAARRGEVIGDGRLAPAVVRYAEALRRAREQDRLRWWVLVLVGAVAVALAGYDTVAGAAREALVSWLVVVLVAAELAWSPRRRDRLMSRVERAEAAARVLRRRDTPGG